MRFEPEYCSDKVRLYRAGATTGSVVDVVVAFEVFVDNLNDFLFTRRFQIQKTMIQMISVANTLPRILATIAAVLRDDGAGVVVTGSIEEIPVLQSDV